MSGAGWACTQHCLGALVASLFRLPPTRCCRCPRACRAGSQVNYTTHIDDGDWQGVGIGTSACHTAAPAGGRAARHGAADACNAALRVACPAAESAPVAWPAIIAAAEDSARKLVMNVVITGADRARLNGLLTRINGLEQSTGIWAPAKVTGNRGVACSQSQGRGAGRSEPQLLMRKPRLPAGKIRAHGPGHAWARMR